MTPALKANLVISLAMGSFVAFIAHLLGSSVWWLWGVVFAVLECFVVSIAQVAALSDYDDTTDPTF